jgi:hypothetical protein
MKKSIGLFLVVVASGCSSTPVVNGVKYEKDQILSTSGDQSQPQWAADGELQPFTFKDGKFFSVGIATISGSDRPEAGLRIAENNSRANFSKGIENKLEFVFQNSEENTGFDSTQAKFIGSEMSSLTTHSMVLEGHFWKRYAQMQEDGSKKIFYKLYALTTMTEPEFKQAIFAAIHKGENEHKLSNSFEKQVATQWNRFVEGKTDSSSSDRTLASPDQSKVNE